MGSFGIVNISIAVIAVVPARSAGSFDFCNFIYIANLLPVYSVKTVGPIVPMTMAIQHHRLWMFCQRLISARHRIIQPFAVICQWITLREPHERRSAPLIRFSGVLSVSGARVALIEPFKRSKLIFRRISAQFVQNYVSSPFEIMRLVFVANWKLWTRFDQLLRENYWKARWLFNFFPVALLSFSLLMQTSFSISRCHDD